MSSAAARNDPVRSYAARISMISPSNFIQGLFLGRLGATRHRHQIPGRGSRRSSGRAFRNRSGQISWPPAGSSPGRQWAVPWPPMGRFSWPPTNVVRGTSRRRGRTGAASDTGRATEIGDKWGCCGRVRRSDRLRRRKVSLRFEGALQRRHKTVRTIPDFETASPSKPGASSDAAGPTSRSLPWSRLAQPTLSHLVRIIRHRTSIQQTKKPPRSVCPLNETAALRLPCSRTCVNLRRDLLRSIPGARVIGPNAD